MKPLHRLLLTAWFLASADVTAAADLAIVGADIVDATQDGARGDQTVIIAGDRISRVGPAGEVDVPASAQVVDARGKWVIPGLIDAHVHFFQSGGLFTRPDVIDLTHVRPYADEIDRIREDLDRTFARYVASGVTGVIDMGGPIWTLDIPERAEEQVAAPRVAAAGPLLGTMAPAEMSALDDPPILHIERPEEARRAVAELLEHEPDLVKIWLVSAGQLASDLEWVRVVVAEAHEAGLPVVAHATRRRIAEAALDAGIDILAHGVDDRVLGEALLTEMSARDIVYVTTLMVEEGYREVLGGDPELSEIERRLGDPQVIASWARLPEARALRGPAVSEAEAENLRRVALSGIPIAAGSDAGNIGTLHGPALHRELELMVHEGGLTPHQVLVAATLGGAKAMGRAAELGTIEEGKLADLVILDANPLEDIRNTRSIHRVVAGGRLLDPAACCD